MSGKPAARVGDKVAGNVIVSGSATVLIGDAGQGCADKACKGSPSVGSPVNPMLGIKVLPGETDFALAAPSPFVFTRSYASDDDRIGALGQGWSIPGASLYMEVSETATVMVDSQGRRITFDALAPSESLFSPSESLWIRRGGPLQEEGVPPTKAWDGRWIGVPEAVQRDPNAIVAMAVSGNDAFVFLAGPTRWRLAQVVDRNSYATEYQWSATGDLRAICDSAGRVYALVYAAHATTREGDNGLRLAGVVLAFDPGREDKPRSTFNPLAKDNDWLVRYGYDAEGNLVEVIDRMGQSVRYFGYRQHIMVRHGQPGGIDVRYTYDTYSPQGKVLTQRNLEGLDYSFDYHRDRTVVTDSIGRVNIYYFAGEAGLRRLVKHLRADGSAVERKYDYAGRLIAVVDPMGRVTRYRQDGTGCELGVTRPDGTTQVIRHDPRTGDLVGTEDPLGRRVTVERDSRGNPVKEVGPDSAVTRYVYGRQNLPNRPSQIIDAKGGVKNLAWNDRGQMISYTDCSGCTTRYQYDSNGDLVGIVNAIGDMVHHENDRLGRPVKIIRSDGAAICYSYDILGRVTKVLNGSEVRLEILYDRWGRILARTNSQGEAIKFSYDAAGRATTLTNENESICQFVFDVMDRMIEETGFDMRCRRYRYNLAGELVETEDAGGMLTCYQRDSLGRITCLKVPATASVSASEQCFVYDAAGQLLKAYNSDVTVLMQYDDAGRLMAEKQQHVDGWNYCHRHVHDPLGIREISQYDSELTVQWMTYGAGHLHGVRIEDCGLDFDRDELHREVHRRAVQDGMPTGLESFRKYGLAGEMTEQRSRLNSGEIAVMDWVRIYRFNALGQMACVQDSQYGEIIYHHDAVGRLIGSHHAGHEYFYRYDPAGNRLNADDVNSNMTNLLKVKNNMVASLGGVVYTYDVVGNVVERVTVGEMALRFDFDGRNCLAGASKVDAESDALVSARYFYDPFGRRIRKEVTRRDKELIVVRFGWDGLRMSLEEKAASRSYVIYEPGGFVPMLRVDGGGKSVGAVNSDFHEIDMRGWPDLFRPSRKNSEWTVYTFHVDAIGVPVYLTNLSARVFWWNRLDDWGRMPGDQENEISQPLFFQGQYRDDETGLNYNHHRYYDPHLGAYISQDPIGLRGGVNLYSYAHQSPRQEIDPLGLFAWHGQWCGPDWTGGRVESYVPANNALYAKPEDKLDAACKKHDIQYYKCRSKFKCNTDARRSCMASADKVLYDEAGNAGRDFERDGLLVGFWLKNHTVGPDVEEDADECPQKCPTCTERAERRERTFGPAAR